MGNRITPSRIFHQRTDVNRDVDYLFKILIYAGTACLHLRRRHSGLDADQVPASGPGQPEPEHVHGNTTLEIAWTVIPLVILI